jgi:rubrerythrin
MLKQATFTRTKEDFICEVCGAKVTGNGYTNHCPHCLASKHVDINPGDRAATCQGMMKPVAFELRGGKEYIIHQCTKCHHTRANKIAKEDCRKALRAVANGSWESYIASLEK